MAPKTTKRSAESSKASAANGTPPLALKKSRVVKSKGTVNAENGSVAATPDVATTSPKAVDVVAVVPPKKRSAQPTKRKAAATAVAITDDGIADGLPNGVDAAAAELAVVDSAVSKPTKKARAETSGKNEEPAKKPRARKIKAAGSEDVVAAEDNEAVVVPAKKARIAPKKKKTVDDDLEVEPYKAVPSKSRNKQTDTIAATVTAAPNEEDVAQSNEAVVAQTAAKGKTVATKKTSKPAAPEKSASPAKGRAKRAPKPLATAEKLSPNGTNDAVAATSPEVTLPLGTDKKSRAKAVPNKLETTAAGKSRAKKAMKANVEEQPNSEIAPDATTGWYFLVLVNY